MRIGLYGGSFNPPHLMHEKIATILLEQKILDKIIFLPTSNFYPKKDLISDKMRLEMLQIITKKYNNMEVSAYEFQKRTYTYETIRYFKELYPKDEIFFLVGSDNFNELETWKNYEEILKNNKLIVIKRTSIPLKWTNQIQKFKKNIEILDLNIKKLSSTEIRKLLKEKNWKELKDKINPLILKYIQEREIYVKISKEKIMKELVNKLIEQKKTIATMESCTGGGVANAITNMEGASEILKFSAVTYSNEYKIKMGVSEKVIEKFTVYSIETAMEMSKKISLFANSDFGVGVTGKLNRVDERNPYGKDNLVFVSIYEKEKDTYKNFTVEATKKTRAENKELVIEEIEKMLLSLL